MFLKQNLTKWYSFLFLITVFAFFLGLQYTNRIKLPDRSFFWKSEPRQKQILLITSGRSGSSFTSILIGHRTDVFYLFEPLYILVQKNMFSDLSFNETRSIREDVSNRVLKSFLTCDFQPKDIYALENTQQKNSASTNKLFNCMRDPQNQAISHMRCFVEFIHACKKSKRVLIKTIRYKLKWAEYFFKLLPDLKVLYLVRDPRAVLYSQSRIFKNFNWKSQVANMSSRHCGYIESDLEMAEKLSKQYPGRIKGIRYEEGATDPMRYAKDIYKFLDLTFTERDWSFVYNITHAPNEKGVYSISKMNSTKTMNKWRYRAGFSSVRIVDENCQTLYPKIGYEKVNSQQDLESERPLVTSPEPGGIFS